MTLPEPNQDSGRVFLDYVKAQRRRLRGEDGAPQTLEQWQEVRQGIREGLARSFGPFPGGPCELSPRLLGQLERDGYRIERLLFQSRPGVWVTANAYVPAAEGPQPAVLVVHGHWPWARIDSVVQARCLGLVKLGYFVLAVDAFGAGERAIQPARGTYHGALVGAMLWPLGLPLCGMQVYDNMRAVDYLLTRPEADGKRLAVTGASGGGNQTMYVGAFDERFQAVVPVCSVGTYDAYLGVASCVCEVVPGALRYTEEGGVLALVAPRALMVVNATKDGIQFSPGEAAKSVAWAREVYRLYDADEKLRHAVFESGHDYNQAMREAMYGWLNRWLKGEGDGRPVPEPEIHVEEIEALRCFPDNKRPAEFHTIPSFAYEQGLRKLAAAPTPDHRPMWEGQAVAMRHRLVEEVFGGFPERTVLEPVGDGEVREADGRITEKVVIHSEAGVPIPVLLARQKGSAGALPTAIVLDLGGKDAALASDQAVELLKTGWQVVAADLRATGETRWPSDEIAGATDHNTTEWALWLGRPLLGQWTWDVLRLVDYLVGEPVRPGSEGVLWAGRKDVQRERLGVYAIGAAGVVALCAAALDERIRWAACGGLPASYVADKPYSNASVPMGIAAPGILSVGDVPHLAALVAPRPLSIHGALRPDGARLDEHEISEGFAFTRRMYELLGAGEQFAASSGANG